MDPLSAIASVVAIIGAISTAYKTISTISGLPKAFDQVGKHLPLVQGMVEDIRDRLGSTTINDGQRESILGVLGDCDDKVKELKRIFDALEKKCKEDQRARSWARVRGWYREALHGVKGHLVETLMNGILEDVKKLSLHEIFRLATQEDVKHIQEALEELSKVKPSLDDSEFESKGSIYANQTVAEGAFGQQNNPSGGSNSFISGKYNVTGENATVNFAPIDHRDDEFLRKLRTTDPRDDKTGVEDRKGGLLEDSYRWVLEHADFKRWRDGDENRLLWVKGDPGKGKTMLLCGIINELKKMPAEGGCKLAYFFCQATEARLAAATAVVRNLAHLLLFRQPPLVARVRDRYGDGLDSWHTLCNLLIDVLQDPSMRRTYLIVDALDECETGLDDLLRFIVRLSTESRAKVLVSSRNWPMIEDALSAAPQGVKLCLELNSEAISEAVGKFIDHKVAQLVRSKKYDDATREAVRHYLTLNANDTFLWVALVCRELNDPKVRRWHTDKKLKAFPPELDALYERMVKQIFASDDAELCRQILRVVLVIYRPVHLRELLSLVESPCEFPHDTVSLREIVELCGSFLTVGGDVVYFVHQSGKDFLVRKASDKIFPGGVENEHHVIATHSVRAMSTTLRRNIYELPSPGFSIDDVKTPDPDPLQPAEYACVYWVDHVTNGPAKQDRQSLQDRGLIHEFMEQHLLHWLEALSLLRSLEVGIAATAKLSSLVQTSTTEDEQGSRESGLARLAHDAWRFTRYHKTGMEASPLQVYCSALAFSPTCSVVKKLFQKEKAEWIPTGPLMEEDWSACLQTLEGHGSSAQSVAFSPDGKQVASASSDGAVRVWHAATGLCFRKLEGHDRDLGSVSFSPNGRQVTSASAYGRIQIWDVATAQRLQTFRLYHGSRFEFPILSPDGKRVAAMLPGPRLRVWDIATRQCLQTFECHNGPAGLSTRTHCSAAFSPDSRRVTSSCTGGMVRVWDTATGQCLQTFEAYDPAFSNCLVAFSPDGKRVASTANGKVQVWDVATGLCLQTLECYGWFHSLAFSPDGKLVASTVGNSAVQVWNVATAQCLQTLEGHGDRVLSVAFSPDGMYLASASGDHTVRIWDLATAQPQRLRKFEGQSGSVKSVGFSRDGRQVASVSLDNKVRVWDAATGLCLQTLKIPNYDLLRVLKGSELVVQRGYSATFSVEPFVVTFSPDSKRVALAYSDRAVWVWDTVTGVCLQTLKFASPGSWVSWGDAGLRTGYSIYNLQVPSGSTGQSPRNNALSEDQPSDIDISGDKSWILISGKRHLWLPPEYRPVHSMATYGNALALGCWSGRVLCFHFSSA
ncbi:hypothetical protein RB595_003997 [Gaeumannomyces hyphopodioides]